MQDSRCKTKATGRSRSVSFHLAFCILSLALFTACCAKPPITDPDAMLPPPLEPLSPPLSVEELVGRYNANLEGLDRLWARTEVSLRFLDADGNPRFERGDGKLIFVRPDHVAITLGKLNQTVLWAGGDDERYWMFDLTGGGVAYVGRHDNIERLDTQQLPLPIYPDEVPYLLGLEPIDEAVILGEERGYVVLQPVDTNLLIMVNPRSGRPARIDVVGRNDRSVLVSRLYDYQPMRIDGEPESAWPKVATRAEFAALDADASFKLSLTDMTDGVRKNRIRERAFDFDTLVEAFKPSRVIDLDKRD